MADNVVIADNSYRSTNGLVANALGSCAPICDDGTGHDPLKELQSLLDGLRKENADLKFIVDDLKNADNPDSPNASAAYALGKKNGQEAMRQAILVLMKEHRRSLLDAYEASMDEVIEIIKSAS